MQPKAAQRLAHATLETWAAVWERVANLEPADAFLQTWWRKHPHFGSRDRRFIAETVYSAFRWKGWLDALPAEPALRLAAAYLLEATEPHVSAQALLELAGAAPDLATAGSLDLDGKAEWLTRSFALTQPPALAQLVPAWVPPLLPADHFDAFVRAIQKRPPLWLRARTGDGATVTALLQREGYQAQPHPLRPDALRLDRAPPTSLIHSLARRGCTPQDLHSQCVALACAPQPGQSWWDVCAGAGGKTLHLADLMQGRGRILATDIRENALQELNRRASTMGDIKLTLRLLRPDAPPPGGPFDGVLVDAPCSGLGTWGRNPDARWRTSLQTVERAVTAQTDLIQRAADHVKPGGTLVYATCSVTQSEGDAVFLDFLTKSGAKPHPFQLPLRPHPSPFITLWPHPDLGAGMYIARAIIH